MCVGGGGGLTTPLCLYPCLSWSVSLFGTISIYLPISIQNARSSLTTESVIAILVLSSPPTAGSISPPPPSGWWYSGSSPVCTRLPPLAWSLTGDAVLFVLSNTHTGELRWSSYTTYIRLRLNVQARCPGHTSVIQGNYLGQGDNFIIIISSSSSSNSSSSIVVVNTHFRA